MMPAIEESQPTPEALAARGMYLFPCQGKKPLVKWQDASTTDINQIRKWQRHFPGCWWGCDCGKTGVVVIDDDRGKNKDAIKSLTALELEYGPLPATYITRTATGGMHYWYGGQGRNSASSKLGKGLDSRGVGGYVIAPCSPGYGVVVEHTIVKSPAWLTDLIGRPLERDPMDAPSNVVLDMGFSIGRAVAYLESAEPAVEGEGGDLLTYKTACKVREFGISQDKCLELMLDHWNDRCDPPWDESDLNDKVWNAYRYAEEPIGADSPQAVFSEIPDSEAALGTAGAPRFKLLKSADVDRFPPMSWRIKGLIPSRGLFQVYGPSTAGKSFFTFDLLAAIAEGREWNGKRTKQAPVLYVCLEGEAGLKQRKDAWEKHNGRKLPDSFLMMAQSWSIVARKDIIDLAALVPQGAVVVIDTQNRAAPMIKETTSEDMGAVIQGAKTLEAMIHGVVGLVAHTGKDVSKGVRGHSSQFAAMDAAIELSRDGEIRTWKTAKAKDGTDGETGQFLLKVIDLGRDADGDPITSCVIDLEVVEGCDTGGLNLNETEAVLWDCIKMLCSESKTGAVSVATWRKEVAHQTCSEEDRRFNQRFSKAKQNLRKKGLVSPKEGFWVVSSLTEVQIPEV